MPRIQAAQTTMVDVELCDQRSANAEREQIVGHHQPGSSEALPPTPAGASIGSGVLNMSNTILGAGMLALPHALAQCGLVVGLLLLVLFAGLSLLGLHLVSAAADLAGRPASFYAVAEKAVPGSGLLIDVAIAVKCFGVATAYLIIVGDAMPQAVAPFGATGVLLDRRLWTLGAAVAVSPLAYLRQIDALRHTSLLALISVLLVTVRARALQPATLYVTEAATARPSSLQPSGTEAATAPPSSLQPYVTEATTVRTQVLVVLFALQPGPSFDPCADRAPAAPCRGAVPLATSAGATLGALPTFVFAFTCHQNVISVTNELSAPTPRRSLTVLAAAVRLSSVLAVYSPCAHRVLTVCSPCAHHVLTICSPCAHHVLIMCSPYAHVMVYRHTLTCTHSYRRAGGARSRAVRGTRCGRPADVRRQGGE